MKQIIAAILIIVLGIGACLWIREAKAWGNRSWFDTTYTFNRAVISLPDGLRVEGEVEQWMDYENSDMIQVVIDDTVYLTHSSNVVLISE
jgi:hypothetical protein